MYTCFDFLLVEHNPNISIDQLLIHIGLFLQLLATIFTSFYNFNLN